MARRQEGWKQQLRLECATGSGDEGAQGLQVVFLGARSRLLCSVWPAEGTQGPQQRERVVQDEPSQVSSNIPMNPLAELSELYRRK